MQLAATSTSTNQTLLRALRMVRVARVLRTFRVVKSLRGLRMMLTMLVLSLPSLVNILSIFLIGAPPAVTYRPTTVSVLLSLRGQPPAPAPPRATAQPCPRAPRLVATRPELTRPRAVTPTVTPIVTPTVTPTVVWTVTPAALTRSRAVLAVLLVYTLLSMQLFGEATHGVFLSDDANFCTFTHAFVTMFRCATGEDWNGLMHDLVSGEQPGGGDWVAVPFFVSFVVISTFVVLKMMIAVIIDNYFLTQAREHSSLRSEHADAFRETCAQFDPNATGRLHVQHLGELIRQLPPPLGLDPQDFEFGRVRVSGVAQYPPHRRAPLLEVIISSTCPSAGSNHLIDVPLCWK